MQIRRLKDIPDLPLAKDLIDSQRGFSFKVDGVELWFSLCKRDDFDDLKKKTVTLSTLLINPYFTEDQIKEMLEKVRLARNVHLYNELITILLAYFKPYSMLNYFLYMIVAFISRKRYSFFSFRSYLMTLPDPVVFDLIGLFLHANAYHKKKLMDMLAATIGKDSYEIWISGQLTVFSRPKSTKDAILEAFFTSSG